jgi:hypothetical protein
MRVFSSVIAVLAATLLRAIAVAAVDSTDEFRDADPQQSSYLPNHNMDPAIVNSPQFGQLWKVSFNSKEQVGFLPFLYCLLDGAFPKLSRPCRISRSSKYIYTYGSTKWHWDVYLQRQYYPARTLTSAVLRQSSNLHPSRWRSPNPLPRLLPELHPYT